MIDLSRVNKYYVACGYTDLRRGIDGLAAIVTQQFGKELLEDSLFLFCGRRTGAELRKLDGRSFRWLMEGLSVEQPKAIRKGRAKDLF